MPAFPLEINNLEINTNICVPSDLRESTACSKGGEDVVVGISCLVTSQNHKHNASATHRPARLQLLPLLILLLPTTLLLAAAAVAAAAA